MQLALQLGGQASGRVGDVDADAGEDAGQFLHVLLGVAGADAHRVQLHDLAGVVLVDVPGAFSALSR